MVASYKIERSVSEREVCVELRCDICDSASQRPSDLTCDGEPWSSGPHTESSVIVRQNEYDASNSFVRVVDVHLCPRCFVDMLLPFIRTVRGERDWEPTVRELQF